MEHTFSEIFQDNKLNVLNILPQLARDLNFGFQITNKQGNFLENDPLCANIFKFKNGSAGSANFFDLISDNDRERITQIYKKLDDTKSFNTVATLRTISNTKKEFTCELFFYELFDDLNKEWYVAGMLNPDVPSQSKSIINHWAYEEIIGKSDEAIIQLGPDWQLIDINKKGLDFTGFSKQELLNSSLLRLIEPRYRIKVRDFYQIQREQKISTTVFEFPIQSKNGNYRWIKQKFHILFDSKGDIRGYIGLSKDVTEMIHLKKQLSVMDQVLEKRVNWRTKELDKINNKLRSEIDLRAQTELALRESEKEYRSLFQNANDAIIIIDAENENILEVNDVACQVYNIERKDFLNKKLKDTLGSEASNIKTQIFQTLCQKKHYLSEITVEVDKKEKILDVHATEVVYKGRKAILSVNRDITGRKQIQKELLDEKTRGLTALIDGQEMERRRLSRELHDGLGQLLTTSLIYIKQLKKNVDPEAAGIAERIKEILENTMEEVRAISHNLMPSVLDDFGLPLALKNMVNNLKKNTETNIELHIDEDIPRMAADVEVGLYRIAQEGLNNALKHAGGATIQIDLSIRQKNLKLVIKDTGPGFAMDSTYMDKRGNGVANMAQRANSINCKFNIQSDVGVGTEICVKYRLSNE